ncbi:MAG: acetylxylan esterase [Alistipes sp.]|nr:acetylxylan esterase [Alistipes sp.]
MKRLLSTTVFVSMFVCAVFGRGLQSVEVVCTQNWIYDDEVFFNVMLSAGEDAATGAVTLCIATDKGAAVCRMSQSYSVEAGAVQQVSFSMADLPSGFYRATLIDDETEAFAWNFGVRPDEVVSASDAKADFRSFWQQTLDELAAVDPEYRLVKDRARSGKLRDVYNVEMRSWGGETIRGYYVVPRAKGKFPVIVTYMGYGAEPWCPDADSRSDVAEFVLSHRGQGLNKPTNTYGDWIRYGMGDKATFYYRGAFMDAVRAIDFAASRDKTDMRNIFIDGGSQGGALTLVAAALDHRVAAAAPFVPFLSDYPDYFALVDWPAAPVKDAAAQAGMADEALYDMLSYFDVKNFTPYIECPVLMGFGLQDFVCPPHTNFAGYNNITTEKSWIVFPRRGHNVEQEPSWWQAREEFFGRHTTH